jgi:hypothetical protein
MQDPLCKRRDTQADSSPSSERHMRSGRTIERMRSSSVPRGTVLECCPTAYCVSLKGRRKAAKRNVP